MVTIRLSFGLSLSHARERTPGPVDRVALFQHDPLATRTAQASQSTGVSAVMGLRHTHGGGNAEEDLYGRTTPLLEAHTSRRHNLRARTFWHPNCIFRAFRQIGGRFHDSILVFR